MIGKRLVLILAVLVTKLSAQDTIYKKDGSVLGAKIIEINISDVKYKSSLNPDAPSIRSIKRIFYVSGIKMA